MHLGSRAHLRALETPFLVTAFISCNMLTTVVIVSPYKRLTKALDWNNVLPVTQYLTILSTYVTFSK